MIRRRFQRGFAEATTKAIPHYVHPKSLEGRRQQYTSSTAVTLASRARMRLLPQHMLAAGEAADANRQKFVQCATQEGGYNALLRTFKQEDPTTEEKVREIAATSILGYVTPHLEAVSADFDDFLAAYNLGPVDPDFDPGESGVAGELLTPETALATLEDRWMYLIERFGDPSRRPSEIGVLGSRVMQATMNIELIHREQQLAHTLGIQG